MSAGSSRTGMVAVTTTTGYDHISGQDAHLGRLARRRATHIARQQPLRDGGIQAEQLVRVVHRLLEVLPVGLAVEDGREPRVERP